MELILNKKYTRKINRILKIKFTFRNTLFNKLKYYEIINYLKKYNISRYKIDWNCAVKIVQMFWKNNFNNLVYIARAGPLYPVFHIAWNIWTNTCTLIYLHLIL